ncbi:DMT family transporter [Novosphingobium sp.]|uniref:DMT family transporter n=1 Tax=Novosphingobium sp. TaxID=1874826 RepID=UPI002733F26C|nr:DMT family transporter [Novosphingobium sp.]MDP3906688.1 DMT family transporter [Novosphingobium sp.]
MSAPRPARHHEHHAAPFIAVTVGIALFSVMDGLMKNASIAAGAYNAMLFRSLIGTALMFPLWKLRGGVWPDSAAMKLHALRGAISGAMATTFFWGLVRVPMAEGIALSFIAPLIALYLAAVLLGETIGKRAILASLLGLAGVLVIAAARLGEQAMSADAAWGIGAILISAVLYAFNLILQRKQALLAGPAEVALFQTVFVALFLGLAAPWLAAVPGTRALLDIGAGAVLAMISLMIISWGYGRAETQVLLPIEYTAFIWAAIIGWFMFAEPVTLPTIIGVVLIVIGCWIAAPRKDHIEQTAL